MIEGVGIDIIEVDRIKRAISRWEEHFLERVFTPQEISYCQKKKTSHISFAGRFAAKEAVMKVLGTGRSWGVNWRGIEIQNDHKGTPQVKLSETITEKFGNKKVLVSISHTEKYAIAQAVLLT